MGTTDRNLLLGKLRHTLSKGGDLDLNQVDRSALVHPWEDSCIQTEIRRFKDVFVFISPVYTALHFIPPILFKRKQFVKE